MTNKRMVSLSIWLYRQFLVVYPAEFRQAYGAEMTQVFATQCRYITNGKNWLRLWMATLVDLLTNSTEEVLMTNDGKFRSSMKTGILFGLVAGIFGSVNAITSAALVGKTGEEVISYIVLLSIAALSFASGVIVARRSKQPSTGLWVGLLIGVVASLIATTTRVGYSIAFYNILRNDPSEIRDWIHRGSTTFVDYLIADRIGGFINTTLLLGFMCGVCSTVGGLIGKVQNNVHALENRQDLS